MHTALDRIRRLRAKAPESYKVQLPAVGGVSVLLGMIAYMAVETSLLLVQMLFGLIG